LPENIFPANLCGMSGIRRVPHQHKLLTKEGKPFRMSEVASSELCALVDRYSNDGELVMDGTAGTLTIAYACLRLFRYLIAVDKDKECIDAAHVRAKRVYKMLKSNTLLATHSITPPITQEERRHADPSSFAVAKAGGVILVARADHLAPALPTQLAEASKLPVPPHNRKPGQATGRKAAVAFAKALQLRVATCTRDAWRCFV
jgi:hypothetical protein